MRIVALLSWWEESPAWLARCIAGVARFADCVVAVDGAYGLVEQSLAFPRSGGEQVEAICAAAAGAGLAFSVHSPSTPWLGNEVEKRSFMFRAGALVAEPGDWFFVVDADEMVVAAPSREVLHEQLEREGHEVGEIALVERTANQPVPGADRGADRMFEALTIRSSGLTPRFFRADPTLRVEGAHYVYAAGSADEPRYLWGNPAAHELVERFTVDGFRSEHWSRLRQPDRRRVSRTYYELRDKLEVETPELAHV